MNMEKTKAQRKMDRMRFCVGVRRMMIDGSERAIEHHKSKIKTFKAQIKEFNRQIYGGESIATDTIAC